MASGCCDRLLDEPEPDLASSMASGGHDGLLESGTFPSGSEAGAFPPVLDWPMRNASCSICSFMDTVFKGCSTSFGHRSLMEPMAANNSSAASPEHALTIKLEMDYRKPNTHRTKRKPSLTIKLEMDYRKPNTHRTKRKPSQISTAIGTAWSRVG